jgi:hypothetical protein
MQVFISSHVLLARVPPPLSLRTQTKKSLSVIRVWKGVLWWLKMSENNNMVVLKLMHHFSQQILGQKRIWGRAGWTCVRGVHLTRAVRKSPALQCQRVSGLMSRPSFSVLACRHWALSHSSQNWSLKDWERVEMHHFFLPEEVLKLGKEEGR